MDEKDVPNLIPGSAFLWSNSQSRSISKCFSHDPSNAGAFGQRFLFVGISRQTKAVSLCSLCLGGEILFWNGVIWENMPNQSCVSRSSVA